MNTILSEHRWDSAGNHRVVLSVDGVDVAEFRHTDTYVWLKAADKLRDALDPKPQLPFQPPCGGTYWTRPTTKTVTPPTVYPQIRPAWTTSTERT